MIHGLVSLVLGVALGLLRLAFRSPAAFLVLVSLLAVPVLFWRRVLSRQAQARQRSRALRWRIRLRLRPGAGFASLAELAVRWGFLAAVRHGGRVRPGLTLPQRLFAVPVTAYAVRLGRAQYCRRVFARMEDQCLILAPQ